MCGRFSLATPAKEWAALFEVESPDVSPRYNIAPTQDIIAVRAAAGGAGQGGADAQTCPSREVEREVVELRWGLVPFWARSPDFEASTFNARSETAASRPAFREPLRHRRCLIPADGFYEWTAAGKHRQPHWIHRPGERPFAFAGLWDSWTSPEGSLNSCTILTTRANEVLLPIHPRMPVILDEADFARWLDPALTDPDRLEDLLAPFPSEKLRVRAVDPRVNRTSFDSPECLLPTEQQGNLFS
ncbi:MAG: SOS response-associated peptidase [Gemmatimonadota bacterium]